MLKRIIKYTDFNNEEQAETFYFNLTSAEMMELSVSHGGNLQAYIEKLQRDKDNERIVALVKEIILLSYGVKSGDGRQFKKNEELRKAFVSSAAYSALFTELVFDDTKQMAFVEGIMPPDWKEISARAEKEAVRRGLLPADMPST